MAFILETVVITVGADDVPHIAPYGLIADGAGYILAPFHPSPAIANLTAVPFAVASATDDVRVIAGCVTGRRDWETVPAEEVPGRRLADALAHIELAVEAVEHDEVRPKYRLKVVREVMHRPWLGYNRAQAAVLEGAILSTRLAMLPRDKVEREMAYLTIAIEKTAGPREQEAWAWIADRIAQHYAEPHTALATKDGEASH
ncbi:DUF447 domain-containing protein [Segnochrobactrum spirostomi]|uniref:DUF447 family protein n=1 Tax=Segnochrobactrum spirostomi TaxID=2608987 RepID=A0A6A7XYG4_9HYPH|nr:DUF447 domain-containing protein [Segnochrobactrum spirostomi]MQT11505.1 DUF447 family protein [Segnochrobactrum spirostomi]